MAKTWKDRLVKEEKKLNKKVNALAAFIEGEYGNYAELPEEDRNLLMTQHAAMTTYLNILAMRMKQHGLMDCEECPEKKETKTPITKIDSLEDFLNHIAKEIVKKKEKTQDTGEEDGRNP